MVARNQEAYTGKNGFTGLKIWIFSLVQILNQRSLSTAALHKRWTQRLLDNNLETAADLKFILSDTIEKARQFAGLFLINFTIMVQIDVDTNTSCHLRHGLL